jgi:hypothetical protein
LKPEPLRQKTVQGMLNKRYIFLLRMMQQLLSALILFSSKVRLLEERLGERTQDAHGSPPHSHRRLEQLTDKCAKQESEILDLRAQLDEQVE